jgi:putative membrane protein
MQLATRERVPALTALLSLASLALVFGAVLGVVPVGALPHSDAAVAAIPHVNAVISVFAFAVIAAGWYWIRRGRVRRHRRAMVTGLVLFFAFLALYLYRVSLEGPSTFGGPDAVYRFIYLPFLTVHVVLAVVCVPLLFYVALLGVTVPVADLPDTRHPQVGRIAAALWLTSFAMGVGVYLLLYVVY